VNADIAHFDGFGAGLKADMNPPAGTKAGMPFIFVVYQGKVKLAKSFEILQA
jgi:hypothetical protein